MVVIQSLVDNLCRCICATDIPACGPFSQTGSGGGGSGGQPQGADGDSSVSDDPRVASKMMMMSSDGVGGVSNRAHLSGMQRQYNRERNSGSPPCSNVMAAGLSTTESSGGGAVAHAAAAAASGVAARLRGSMECSDTALFRGPRMGVGGGGGGGVECSDARAASAQQGVPAAVSSDVSSRSTSSMRMRGEEPPASAAAAVVRPVNSVETAEDREAKEALAEARREAGRQSGRRHHHRHSSSMSSSRGGGGAGRSSSGRSGKRKADIFRSRNNVLRPSTASNAALADDECGHDPVEEDDDSDDEIVGLGNHRQGAAGAAAISSSRGPSSIFMCADPSETRGNARAGGAAASRMGRMMLCFATPVHGSDSDEDEEAARSSGGYQSYYAGIGAGGPCGGPRDVDSPVGGQRRGRKAARTSEGESDRSTSRHSSSRLQDQNQNKVRTVADDLEELEAMEAERERLERQEEALRNGEPLGMNYEDDDDDDLDDILRPSRDDAEDEMTAATNADDTITSTLYFDAKLGKVVDSAPRPPVPLFQQFKVDVDEEKDDEIKKIIKTGSHKTLSIMQMWKQSSSSSSQPSHHPPQADVLRSTPTAHDVVGALGVVEQEGGAERRTPAPSTPPRRQEAHYQQRRGAGPPVVRQVTPPESRFNSAPRAPVLLGAADPAARPMAGRGMNIDFAGETSSSSSSSSGRERRSTFGRGTAASAQAQVLSADV